MIRFPYPRSFAPLAIALSLAFADGCAERDRPTADPDAAFRAQIGREWVLVQLGARAIAPPPAGTPADSPGVDLVPGRPPTIRFSGEPPALGGRSFCNSYGGPYLIRGDSLQIESIESTLVGCDDADSLETRFFRALREARRFELDSASLALITEDGTRLVFVPATSATPRPKAP